MNFDKNIAKVKKQVEQNKKGGIRAHAAAALAALILGTAAFAGGVGPTMWGRGGSTVSSSMIQTLAQAASGWTYNGTQSLATKDVSVANTFRYYLDGATRVTGIYLDSGIVKISGAAPLGPATDQAINLGTTAIRWSNLYLGELNLGAGAARRTLIASTPTIAAACTSPTVTHGNTVSFQMDVGTGCAVSTVTLTLSAADNGWSCRGRHITSGATRYIEQTGAVSTTSVTMTNFVRTTGVAGNFADGDDLSIECMAR